MLDSIYQTDLGPAIIASTARHPDAEHTDLQRTEAVHNGGWGSNGTQIYVGMAPELAVNSAPTNTFAIQPSAGARV